MSPCGPGAEDGTRSGADQITDARLAAIEGHLHHIEAMLVSIGQFNSRLDQIHATLELAIGFLTPGADAADRTVELPSAEDHTDKADARFRVIAHLRRDGHGARLIPDVAWTDMWSVRLFVTGLLRTISRSGLPALGCRCWCEVWAPDETGEFVDSAFLDPDTGAVDWESDLLDRQNDS